MYYLRSEFLTGEDILSSLSEGNLEKISYQIKSAYALKTLKNNLKSFIDTSNQLKSVS